MTEVQEIKKVLVVGAGGFVGGFLVEEALRRGWQVWAGVRSSTSRAYLTDSRIRFVELDFENPESLAESLHSAMPEGKWDYIVYNLGATKVRRYADFSRINYDYLRYFTGALAQSGLVPEKFLYMSSLSAMGTLKKGVEEYTEDIIPAPNTRYGVSKLKAETWLATAGIPYIIFRPTGIYGPRDHDYYLEFKSLAKGFDFQVGFRKQTLTFLYVEDLARAVCDALERSATDTVYILSEPRNYTQKQFRKIVKKGLGRKFVLPVKLPLWMVRFVSFFAEKYGVAVGKPSTLNRDKCRILSQRNWSASTAKAAEGFGFSPRVFLQDGVERSIEWYRKEGWLK